jgi:NitT/TauT family transport system substrate-binding protein
MRMRGRTTVAAIAMIAAFGVAAAAKAEPLTIRVGWVVTPGHMAPLIAALGKREPAVFKHLSGSYVMQALRFNGTTPQIQAQAIGDLEVASFSTSAVALAITNAHLDERLVADVVGDGHPGYFSENFVVLKNGPIHRVEDVKSRRVATNVIGSASDTAMRTMFRKHDVKDSDFTTVEANFANMPAMLDAEKVNLIGTLPQFAQELKDGGKYRVLFTARDAVGPTQAVVWAIRSEIIAAHRPALIDFFEDHIRAVRWFLDPVYIRH